MRIITSGIPYRGWGAQGQFYVMRCLSKDYDYGQVKEEFELFIHYCSFITVHSLLFIHYYSFITVHLLLFFHYCSFITVLSLLFILYCSFITVHSLLFIHQCSLPAKYWTRRSHVCRAEVFHSSQEKNYFQKLDSITFLFNPAVVAWFIRVVYLRIKIYSMHSYT